MQGPGPVPLNSIARPQRHIHTRASSAGDQTRIPNASILPRHSTARCTSGPGVDTGQLLRLLRATCGGSSASKSACVLGVLAAAWCPRRASGSGLDPHTAGVQIVFDATSACVHPEYSRKVNAGGAPRAAGGLRRDRGQRVLAQRRPGHAQEHRRVHAHDSRRGGPGRWRKERHGDHHHQPGRAAA